MPNIETTRRLLALTGRDDSLITYVADRPGHDRRYAIDCGKLRGLGWERSVSFDQGLSRTVDWFREHRAWWSRSSPARRTPPTTRRTTTGVRTAPGRAARATGDVLRAAAVVDPADDAAAVDGGLDEPRSVPPPGAGPVATSASRPSLSRTACTAVLVV